MMEEAMKPRKQAPQTFEEYLVTMKAYRFISMNQELWEEWQAYWNTRYNRVPKIAG